MRRATILNKLIIELFRAVISYHPVDAARTSGRNCVVAHRSCLKKRQGGDSMKAKQRSKSQQCPFCFCILYPPLSFKGSGDKSKSPDTADFELGLLLPVRGKSQQCHFFSAPSNATATATDAPTIGLLPIPIKPIISTWAGTDDEPANWASECIRPMVSVMP